jgi:hypothetical protein
MSILKILCLRRPGALLKNRPWTPQNFSYTVSLCYDASVTVPHYNRCNPLLFAFVILVIVIWNLFVICDLEFVIFIFSSLLTSYSTFLLPNKRIARGSL